MSNVEPAPFGALLLHHRAVAGLTQEQLAARAGLSPDTIAALEHGRRRAPRSATVELLASALGLGGDTRTQFLAAARTRAPGQAGIGAHEEGDGQRAATPRGSLATLAMLAASPPTPLVDRSDDLAIIRRLLTVEGTRLLTLTGPAGVGKTRLALAAAAHLAAVPDHFPDGVAFADLAPVRETAQVLRSLANAINLLNMGSRSWLERLVEALGGRQLLVVLDNFEQVLPAAAQLADLLAMCPGLALLVTSRMPLQLRWEQTLRIAPLPVPDLSAALPTPDALLTIPSVELFVGRARAQRADFALTEQHAPLVAHVTVQLDGLPLALELAAARLDVLSLPTLARHLDDRLQLLASEAPDVPARQRSLEAAVGWSYDLLGEEERRLFRCLGVFVGRVSLDAIDAITIDVARADGADSAGEAGGRRTLDGLLSLAKQSLILPGRPADAGWEQGWSDAEDTVDAEDAEPTFGMLETVREFAWERLAATGELADARRAHAHYFLALAEQADSQLRGRNQRNWFLRLEREQDNLRAALRWLLDQDDDAQREAALRLAGAMGWFWTLVGYHAEGMRWLEEALARAPQGADPDARARALVALGAILQVKGEVARARAALEEALALAEQRQTPTTAATACMLLGSCMLYGGEVAEATRLLHEALRRWETLGDHWGVGNTLSCIALLDDALGDLSSAVAHYTAGLHELEVVGDEHHAGYFRCYLAVAAWKLGNLRNAVAQLQTGLRTSVAFRDRWLLSIAAQSTAALVWTLAQPDRRALLLGAADALTLATGTVVSWERTPGGQDIAGLRERLARGEGEGAATYRAGRALPVGETATLVLRMLEEVVQALTSSEDTSQTAQEAQRPAARHPSQSTLTTREREVLQMVAQGLSSKAIGRQISLSPSTVNQHVKAIFNKLGVDTRAQAVAVAAQRGLL